MRKPNISLLMLLLFLCTFAKAQELHHAKEQQFSLNEFLSQKDYFSATKAEDKYFLQLRFKQIPSGELLQHLHHQQVQLLSYQGEHTYLATVPAHFLPAQLIHLGIETVAVPTSTNKLSPALRNNERPAWSSNADDEIALAINFHQGISSKHIDKIVREFGIKELEVRRNRGTLIVGNIKEKNVAALSDLPAVAALSYRQEEDQMLNFECRKVQGVASIQSTLAGGINLRGHGVVIGVGDGGQLGEHADLAESRVFNEANGTYSSFGAHGDHVAGIIAGSGVINPRHRGIASESEIITQKTSLVTYYTPDYYANYGMVLTNNSYGTTSNCELNGSYNYSSQSLDLQLNDFPEILHVFAAGNSGWETCGDYPKSYHTVLRYYQASKNVLTVGNVKDTRVINPNSSRGPLLDGRLKPEICGVGTSVMSTDRDNGYWSATGTSMSAPAVTATISLMVQRYRENNSGNNPEGALMKAIACNTASDLGNAGPDFTYGYGLINARNAINTIDNDDFLSAQIEDGKTNTHQLAVPGGTEKIKIMLYWHDKEADATTATTALVNDLDLKVKSSDGSNYLPWVLDPSPANVENPAVRGADRLNNIEQVTIDNPAAGNYELEVSGFSVPFGPQKYYLTYEFVRSEVKIIYPKGGESLEPNITEKIRWDADESNTHDFLIEWSGDNGATWTTVKSKASATTRQVSWRTPEGFTEEALVRVSKIGTSVSDVSETTFAVVASPTNLSAEPICTGYVDLGWSMVEGASAYQVLMMKDEEMVVLETTTDTSFVIEGGLMLGDKYWFSVRCLGPAGAASERAVAISCIPENVGSCDWENDATINVLTEELRGRAKTSSALGQEDISVEIENIGANDLSTVTVHYSINKEETVSEVINTPILKGEKLTYTFTKKADLSEAKEYEIDVWIEVPGDERPENDHIEAPIQAVQLSHPQLSLPLIETFDDLYEGLAYTESYIGPKAVRLWDFDLGEGSMAFASYSDDGGMGLTIGNTGVDDGTYENKATLNLELSGLVGSTEEVYLVFNYKNSDKIFTLSEKLTKDKNVVYVRGSQDDEWIELIDLPMVEDTWERINNINLTRVLQSEGQAFSSSFQIMFSQVGSMALVLDDVSLANASRLPVTLDTFSAEKIGEHAKLKWKTRSEEGNDFFVIEMAEGVDGVISGDFQPIGQVKGQGFSQRLHEYEFVDAEADKLGDRYYRLRQVDFGGRSTVSEFRVVSFSNVQEEVAFFPNPFKSNVTLSLKTEVDQQVHISIYNAKGQLVKEYQEQFQEGRQELPLKISNDLSAGLYTVNLAFADKTIQSIRISKIQD